LSIHVTIETASKAEAELIAEDLPVKAEAEFWRGFGVIRLPLKSAKDVQELLELVSRSFDAWGLRWARVRYDDEERVFKANGQRPNGHAGARTLPSASSPSA
jgi:hypothetical protein